MLELMNAKLTKYPKLYKDTYWGRFKNSDATSNVVCFRNTTANFFKLKKYIKNSGVRPKDSFFDHTELYQTEKGTFIYFTSPYNHFMNEAYALQLGFTRLKKPFYSPNATTWFKKFETKKEYTAFLRKMFDKT